MLIHEIKFGESIPTEFLNIYHEAFPPSERRDWNQPEDVRVFMDKHSNMHLCVGTDTCQAADDCTTVCALMVYWALSSGVLYVEHLATRKEARGLGLGAQMMQYLLSLGKPLLLEVEPPTTELTRRRIGFYERLGLTLHSDIPYIQPPYAPGLSEVELMLMTTSDLNKNRLRNNVVRSLKEEVYGFKN